MKTLLAGILLILSAGSFASNIEVYSKVHNRWAEDIELKGVEFAVNANMGRAAVKFYIADHKDDESVRYTDEVQVLDGLYFDQATQNIMYDNTVCATTRIKSGLFGTKRKIRTTGNCTFQVEKSTVEIDNGFDIYTKNKIALYMNVR